MKFRLQWQAYTREETITIERIAPGWRKGIVARNAFV